MPDTLVAPPDTKAPVTPAAAPAPPAAPPANGHVAKPPGGLDRTLRDLGRALNKDGALEEVATPPIPPSEMRGKSIGEWMAKRREEAPAAPPDDKKNGEEKKDGEPPKAGDAPPADDPAKKVDDKPPIEVAKKPPVEDVIKRTVDHAIDRVVERLPAAPPSPPAPITPEAKPADAYEAALGELEKEEISLARYAAAQQPDRYKDFPDKLIGFYKKLDGFVERHRKDNPDQPFDENGEEFQKFIADNKPRYQGADRRKLERAQIVDETRKQVKEDTQKETQELRQRQHILEVKPRIESTVKEFKASLKDAFEAPKDEPAPVRKLRETVISVHENKATERAADYLALDQGAVPFDASNENHAWILHFIRDQGAYFAHHGGDARIRVNSKTGEPLEFMPFEQYRQLARNSPEKAARHWTFSERQILDMIKFEANKSAQSDFQTELDRLKSIGWEPAKEAEPKPKDDKKRAESDAPAPVTSPRAPGSAAPGLATPGKIPGPPSPFGPADLKVLGVKMPGT